MMMSAGTSGASTETADSVAETVLMTVADKEGITPTQLEPSLYDVIDPDALNALFAPTETGNSRAAGYVVFAYCGYEITISSDGSVRVD